MAKEVNFTEEDWLNELTQFYPVQVVRKPGGITQQEAAKLWKIDTRTACARLNAMVDEGALYRERAVCDDGVKRYVYYKNTENNP